VQLAYGLMRLTEKEMEKKRRQVAELKPARPPPPDTSKVHSLREERTKRNAMRSYLLSRAEPVSKEPPLGEVVVHARERSPRVVAPSPIERV
jgi:hypothetical protein